jgi:hypothetical protein
MLVDRFYEGIGVGGKTSYRRSIINGPASRLLR